MMKLTSLIFFILVFYCSSVWSESSTINSKFITDFKLNKFHGEHYLLNKKRINDNSEINTQKEVIEIYKISRHRKFSDHSLIHQFKNFNVLKEQYKRPAIRIPKIHGSSKIYLSCIDQSINQFFLNTIKNPLYNHISSKTFNTKYQFFEIQSELLKCENVNLIINVDNTKTRNAKIIYDKVIFDDYDNIYLAIIKEHVANLVILGILIFVSIYHFILYLLRKKDLASLYFSMFCMIVSGRMFVIHDYTFIFRDSMIIEAIAGKIEYLAMALGPLLLIMYLENVIKNCSINYFKYFLFIYSFLLTLIILISNSYNNYLSYYQVFLLFSVLYIVIVIVKGLFKKDPNSKFFLIGLIFPVMGVINDIQFSINGLHLLSYYIFPFCFTVFVLFQAYLIAKLFSDTYKSNIKLYNDLKEHDRARTLFFHNTSHELRTPLNGILGFTETILKRHKESLDPDVLNKVTRVSRLADSLRILVNTILDIAKAQKGQLDVNKQNISLRDLYNDSVVLAEGLIADNNNYVFSHTNNLSPENDVFYTDKEKVFSILRNLLGNAIKFIDYERSNTINFEFILNEKKDLEITVSDTGIGIEQNKITEIFDEFKQGDSDTNRAYEGTGLGLSMVKSYVDVLGGTIKVSSKIHQGSQFSVTIPTNKSDQKNDLILTESFENNENIQTNNINETVVENKNLSLENTIEENKTHNEYSINALDSNKSYHVLIVDDNHTNLEVIDDFLKEYSFFTTKLDSGFKAKDFLLGNKPDIILLDLMMPGMSGEELLKYIRSNEDIQSIPVILITARASEDDRILGFKLGADDYLPKPINSDELYLRMNAILTRLQLHETTETLIETQKLSSLGEMMGDLSHEIKNLTLPAVFDIQKDTESMKNILSIFDGISGPWNTIKDAFFHKRLPYKEKQIQKSRLMYSYDSKNSKNAHVKNLLNVLSSLDISYAEAEKFLHESINGNQTQVSVLGDLLYNLSKLIVISENCSQINDLVLSTLNYARKESSQTDTIYLDHVLNSCLRILEKKIEYDQISINLENLNEKLEVKFNQSELYQVIMNLLSNAIDSLKNVSDSSIKKEIQISSNLIEDRVEIHIVDNGPGIAEQNIDKVFKKSFTTKGTGGSGIGLHVVKKLIEKNNGSISVHSKENENTTFTLNLKIT